MAVYFLKSERISRRTGAHVTAAAAYRAGERIHDKRAGLTFDHSKRDDVLYKEILLPAQLADRPDMAWARDRSTLWNTVERTARQHNSRLAIEWLALLPDELTQQQRCDLARQFARRLTEKFQSAVDLCVHPPRPWSDERFHHAHILMTTRQVTPVGLGRRTNITLNAQERDRLGIPGTWRDDYDALRELWADLTNDALRKAGLTARVDHRTLAEQGIDREPVVQIPRRVFYAELRSQKPHPLGEVIRARHRERVEARKQGPEEYARVVQRQKAEAKREIELRKQQLAKEPKKIRVGALSREERCERYRARRAIEKQDPVGEARRREIARERSRKWLDANRQKAREATRRWQRQHPDKHNACSRRYRQKNAEKVRAKQRERYQVNREERLRKDREYRLANAEAISHRRRERRRANAEEINRKQRESYQANREERARKAREYRQANREEINRRRRERREEKADEANRKQREYREKNAEELNRKRRESYPVRAQECVARAREYRRLHGDEINRKRRENTRMRREEKARAMWASPTREQAVENWQEYRRTHGPGPTAEESARNWAASRQQELGRAQGMEQVKETGRRESRSRAQEKDLSLDRDIDFDLSM